MSEQTADQIKLKLFNAALRNAQSPTIDNLSDDNNSANACADLWDSLYDDALQEFLWPWAGARAELTADTTKPPGVTWESQYTLPSGFLRLAKIDTLGVGPSRIEGTKILTKHSGNIVVVYTRRVELPSTSAVFRLLAQRRLAVDLAVVLKERARQLRRDLEIRVQLQERKAEAECSTWSVDEAYDTATPERY